MTYPLDESRAAADYVEIHQEGEVAACDDAIHKLIMFQFFDRGVAVLLTYAEVLTLGKVLAAAVAYVRRGHDEKACTADGGCGGATPGEKEGLYGEDGLDVALGAGRAVRERPKACC